MTIQLGNAIVDKLQAKYPDSVVTTLNLVTDPFPHLSATHLEAFYTPAGQHTPAQAALAKRSEDAILALKKADIIVIGAPMHNYSIPSALKAFIDHIVRAGITFSVTPDGELEGLLKNKKAYIAFSSGWDFSSPALKPFDFSMPYLRAVLAILGISDITAYRVEGPQAAVGNVISDMVI